MTSYIFNPEHDLALANNSENYEAPLSARQFANDLALLPLWYAESDSLVIAEPFDEWKSAMEIFFPQLKSIEISAKANTDSLSPWGWNTTLIKRFPGIKKEYLNEIRMHSHRRWSLLAMNYLREQVSFVLPFPAMELKDQVAIDSFLFEHRRAILKAPFSGSGRGVWRCFGGLSQSAKGWCYRTLEKQGSIMGEPLYDNVCDFAMEFLLQQGEATFVGYSLFETEAMGVYVGGTLASNDALERILIKKIPHTHLVEVKLALLRFFETYFSFYQGVIGVDMLIYREKDGSLRLNPMVEINLRMTMGMVARRFFDNFVQSYATGVFRIDRFDTTEELYANDLEQRIANPLIVNRGRIQSGYFSLCPIQNGTHYRASVSVI